jgi:23S rRNA pseudouridine1911/1915/1917 synthase
MNGGQTGAAQDGETRTALLPPDAAGWRLDRALAAAIPTLSRERLKALVSAGDVLVEGRQERDPARKMKGGEAVSVLVPAARPSEAISQDIPLDIRFEDDHLLVVEKPAGLVVHPAAGNLDGTLVNALLHHCAGRLSGIGGVARPGIVHRIDKDTSGLLVVAKTDRAHAGLAAQFAKHTIGRRYLAVVAGLPTPPAGRIETNLARSDANRQKIAVVSPPKGKRAVTHYRVLEPLRNAASSSSGPRIPGAALVECRLETGRTHQVRVHMAHIGHPLLGDPVYGQGRLAELCRRLGFQRQALHAAELKFEHPITKEILTFESVAPPDIQELLSALRD